MNGHRSSSNNSQNVPLPVAPNSTNSLLIPVGMYVYSIIYVVILITSPTAILNYPINSLCPLDTALVLTSDDFHSIFSPFPPLFPFLSRTCTGGTFRNCQLVLSLKFVHIHLFSSDRETDL